MMLTNNIIDLAVARQTHRQQAALNERFAAGGFHADRLLPDALQRPRLARAIEVWRAMAGRDGVLRTGRQGALNALAGTPLLGERSMLVMMTGDQPESWLIGYYGRRLIEVTGGQYLTRRFSDLPGTVTNASITSLRQVLPERRPAAHRITGAMWGPTYSYDRLVLPFAGAMGRIDGFVTISERLGDRGEMQHLPR